MEYLIIDGYNLINAWSDVFKLEDNSLEECRDKLFSLLSNYQGYKKTKIIVVFDAHLLKGSQEKIGNYDNLTIVFTKENETADNYIEKFVYKLGSTNIIRVVTSDYLEQTMILRNGGFRVSPREFRLEILVANDNIKEVSNEIRMKRNTIMSHLEPELLQRLEKLRRDKF